MTNNNYNVQTDEQIARDILSILPDAPEDPNKEPTESPKVFMLPIRQLKSFQNHPFKIVDNDEMKDLMHSIRDYGVMTPITVYVNKNAEYEIVSGHRRVFACKMLKMTEIPAIIMDYDRDQAVLAMVDSNLHREKLLPSEKGFAYKMKLEALKNQHREMEFEMQIRSDEILAKEVGEIRATIQRLIRITKLISPFRDLLDYECMTFGVAYVFAGCDPVGQDMLYCFFYENNVYPNLEQAKALQKLWESNTLTIENIRAIMIPEGNSEEVKAPKSEKEKAPKKESVKFGVDELSDYFPGMNAADMKAEMFSILAEWKSKQSVVGGESY